MANLIVYFSHPGETFVDGQIVFNKVGNTKRVAEKIQSLVGGDLYELIPVNRYDEKYVVTNERARQELIEKDPPKLLNPLTDVSKYDVIFIGFPIWHRSYPRIIDSFLENVDLSGKTVKLFCTNDEGSFGTAELELGIKLRSSKLRSGLSVRGVLIEENQERIAKWANKI